MSFYSRKNVSQHKTATIVSDDLDKEMHHITAFQEVLIIKISLHQRTVGTVLYNRDLLGAVGKLTSGVSWQTRIQNDKIRAIFLFIASMALTAIIAVTVFGVTAEGFIVIIVTKKSLFPSARS